MRYENLNQALNAFQKLQEKQAAYNHAIGVLNLDASTAAPSDSWEGRSRTFEVLSQVVYDLTASDENGELFAYLAEHEQELDAVTRRKLEVMTKEYDRIRRIPAAEYVEYNVLRNDAQAVWAKAKVTNDFALFAPYLEKIVAFNKKFAGYYHPEMLPYNALLNEFEEGITMEILDNFFVQLRKVIVPLLDKVSKAPQIDDSVLNRKFPVWQQREFSDYLMKVLGLDRAHCNIGETEHPFTTNFNNKDVRITTHYYENHFSFAMFSVIHEGGHAIYELGADDQYNYTALSGGISMGIHESQSRFYENLIGRSAAFIHVVYPELCRIFPEQMKDVDETMLFRAVNKAQPSLIRTEADELTYPLHIMVRYEIEKEMISGKLEVKDIPARWNALYKEYLGIDVPDDTHGCLQDSHWSGGSIGYFPSYALGSAYGAQFLSVMQKELGDIYVDVANGDLSRITAWLREHIHHYASFKKPNEILADICGEFDGKYYTDYLTEKFTKLYNL